MSFGNRITRMMLAIPVLLSVLLGGGGTAQAVPSTSVASSQIAMSASGGGVTCYQLAGGQAIRGKLCPGISVGRSGPLWPDATLYQSAKYRGKSSVIINVKLMESWKGGAWKVRGQQSFTLTREAQRCNTVYAGGHSHPSQCSSSYNNSYAPGTYKGSWRYETVTWITVGGRALKVGNGSTWVKSPVQHVRQ